MIVGEGVSTRSVSGRDDARRQRRGRGGGGIERGRWAPERAGCGWPVRGSGWQGLRRLAGPGRRRRSRRVRRRRRPGGGGQPRTLPAGPARSRTGTRRRIMLSAVDREEISRGIAEGVEGAVIAARIGRDPSVISREIARHGGRERY